MNLKKISGLFLFLFILLLGFVSADCTLTLGKEIYIPGETATATMICTLGNEKGVPYTLNWTFANGTVLESDTGTTPLTSINFFESYVIPTGYPIGVFFNATLTGTNLEGTDSANVTAAGTNSLIITNVTTTAADNIRLSRTLGVSFVVTDNNSKLVSNAQCDVSLADGIGNPLLSQNGITYSGRANAEFLLSPETFIEDRSYLIALKCFCGSVNNSKECINSDGISIINRVGNINYAFDIVKWLTVNTVVDKTIYEMKNTIFICANVTNTYDTRVGLRIYYNVRCSQEKDNNSDLDRALIISSETELRGISANTTQMQCKQFVIPQVRYLEGRNSECYAGTGTWIIDEQNNDAMGYSTASSVFNITSDTINIPADWVRINNYTFNTIINLSETKYSDWNGTGTGEVDIILDSASATQIGYNTIISLESLLSSNQIKSITAVNSVGAAVTSALEFPDDGNIEVELRSVDISQSGYYNVTIEFYDFEERQTEALEGIENKTGTFHLAVDCPSQGKIGSNINCSITAQIEDPQVVQKEVDFTCYISDGTNSFSSLNFNQMVNKTVLTLFREFAVPSSFTDYHSYVLQCHADYYNLGSRRDSFYDTFTAVNELSSGTGSSGVYTNPITGDAIITLPEGETGEKGEGIGGEIIKIITRDFWIYGIIIAFLILALIILKKSSSKSSKILFISLFVVGIIGILYYGVIFFNGLFGESVNGEDLIKDTFIRGIILTIFISLVLAFLFKVLNIRGEVKFGEDGFLKTNRAIKEQEKLNKLILKNELKKEKNLKRYRIVKIKK